MHNHQNEVHNRKNDKVSANIRETGESSNANKDQGKTNSDLLNILGESIQESVIGPPIREEIAKVWQQICQ